MKTDNDKELIDELKALTNRLRSGEYDGVDIKKAWIAMNELRLIIQGESKPPTDKGVSSESASNKTNKPTILDHAVIVRNAVTGKETGLYHKPVSSELLIIGEKYNWKYQPERLIYIGYNHSGNGNWHQFAKVETPKEIWCECLDADLVGIIRTEGVSSEREALVLQVYQKSHCMSLIEIRELVDLCEQHFEQSGWVSVKDRLPDDLETVLCYEPNCDEDIFTYRLGDDVGCAVTHWMPLPESPGE